MLVYVIIPLIIRHGASTDQVKISVLLTVLLALNIVYNCHVMTFDLRAKMKYAAVYQEAFIVINSEIDDE